MRYARKVLHEAVRRLRADVRAVVRHPTPRLVHQARISGRRLRTSLWVFGDLFPGKERRRWIRRIRRIEKAFAPLRDADVQIAHYRSEASRSRSTAYRRGLRGLIEYTCCRRRALQQRLSRRLKNLSWKQGLKEISRRCDSLSMGMHRRRLVRTAQKRIARRIKVLAGYERVIGKECSAADLHRMRIAARKLRYTLEALRSVYEGRLDEAIARIQALQRMLGRLHDLVVLRNVLMRASARGPDGAPIREAAGVCARKCTQRILRGHAASRALWRKYKTEKLWSALEQTIDADRIKQ